MDNTKQILELVASYQQAIHTQKEREFKDLWSKEHQNILISITNQFIGIEDIYKNFLIAKIQKNYTHIDLITENIDVSFINEEIAIVVFQYHTECIRRNTNEEYGIQGLETQVVVKEKGLWKLMHIHYSK